MTAPGGVPELAEVDRQMLQLLVEGRSLAQAGRAVGLGSTSNAAMRLLRVRRKLGAETTVQAVAILLRAGRLT